MKPVILWNDLVSSASSITPSKDGGGSHTASGYAAANVKDFRPFTRWRSDGTGTFYLTLGTFGSNTAADAFAVVGHNLGTVGATVTIQNNPGGGWPDVTGATKSPSDDKPFLVLFTSDQESDWRIKIVAPTAAAELGVILLGARTTFPVYPDRGFDPDSEENQAIANTSQEGHLLGIVERYQEHQIEAVFSRITDTWATDTFKVAWDAHLRSKPFFWAWDMDGRSDEVYFVRVPQPARLAMPFDPVRRTITLSMIGRREV